MFLFPSFLLWLASLVLLPFLWPHSFLYIDFIYAVKYFSFPQKWENVCDEVMKTLQHYNIKTWIFFSHTLRSLRFLLYQIINSISYIESLKRKPKLLSHPYFFLSFLISVLSLLWLAVRLMGGSTYLPVCIVLSGSCNKHGCTFAVLCQFWGTACPCSQDGHKWHIEADLILAMYVQAIIFITV